MLVDLVQLSKGLGVWFRVSGVGRCVWCLVMKVGCLLLGVGCLVLCVGCCVTFSNLLRGWVLGVGCWVVGVG